MGGSTIVGTNNLTITFSEAVTGVSGNEEDGTCDPTKTIKLTNYAGTCYGMTILIVDNVYTIDPKTDLISGSYMTLGSGITDALATRSARVQYPSPLKTLNYSYNQLDSGSRRN